MPENHFNPMSMSNSFSNHIECYHINQLTTELPRLELDSHADSPVVGHNAHIMYDTGKCVDVSGFTDTLGYCKTIPIVHAAVAYDCPNRGTTTILKIYNALYFKNMANNLIPPFIMRLSGLEVDECPKFLSKTPNENNHSIYDNETETRIPLLLHGIISYFPTRIPLSQELTDCNSIDITPNASEWDPHTRIYEKAENNMCDTNGNIRSFERPNLNIFGVNTITHDIEHNETLHNISSIYSIDKLSVKTSEYNNRDINSVTSGKKRGITPAQLSELWDINLKTAETTINKTTQKVIRTIDGPSLKTRYSTNDRMLRYPRTNCVMFMDTMFSSIPSADKHTCAQIMATEFSHVKIYPMKSQKDIALVLKRYFKEVGVPNMIICDSHKAQIMGETRKLCALVGCSIFGLEAATPQSNRAELRIGILKRDVWHLMHKMKIPMRFWDLCAKYRCEINNCIAHNLHYLDSQVPNTKMTGQPTDISHICEFKFYEWVYYLDHTASFPNKRYILGRCLGPSENFGNCMSQYVLNSKGKIIPRQTIRKLTKAELNDENEIKLRDQFTTLINKKFGQPPEAAETGINDTSKMKDIDHFESEDEYLKMEIMLPHEKNNTKMGKVIRRCTDEHNQPLGKKHNIPIYDTRLYDVEFSDGSIHQYSANVLAENMLAQVDEEGYQYQFLEAIIDHRTDATALKKGENTKVINNKKVTIKTTKGWFFNVKWKDGTTSWVPLKELKESNPCELADYTRQQNIDKLPAFDWWVPHTIKKRNHIIKSINSRCKRPMYKYGIRIPTSVRDAYEIDRMNNNTFWTDAIRLEMKNVGIAFDILPQGANKPIGSQFVDCFMHFEVKMDFRRKARLVAGGHVTTTPETSTYAGVVSRESVRIAFLIAALNDLDILAADIQNAYLTAPPTENYYTKCGPEFGSQFEGRYARIVRALYGLKSSGAAFRNHLRDCMSHLKYTSCSADPDVWLRPAVNNDGSTYYEYLLLYVDDVLAISKNPNKCLEEINQYFPLKPGSIGDPKFYLGTKISKVRLPNQVVAWAFSSSKYIKSSVENLEKILKQRNLKLSSKKMDAPISNGYRPEMDISDELNDEDSQLFQSLIGILRWTVEIGRIDICAEVSMLSSHLALPRHGHLQEVFNVFSYLKQHHNSRIVFDPSYPHIDDTMFPKHDWSSFYGKIKEEIPENIPTPLGRELVMTAFVDADHAGDKTNRRSRTGFIIYLNNAPIYWLSKKQTSVETSSFGSEMVAMRQCAEYIRGLRYKIRMMGIPLNDPSFVYGDNKSMIYNTSIPESVLRKKNNSITYHFIREGTACGEWKTAYIPRDENIADILTAARPAGIKRSKHVNAIMYDMDR